MDIFGNHSDSFLGESSIVALYSNIFEKLNENEMKNWNLHSNFSNPQKNYQKDNVQSKVDFTKNGTTNVTFQTTLKKISL